MLSKHAPANQPLTRVQREHTFTRGQVIRALPRPVGEAAKSPMAHAEVEACGALQHHKGVELSQSSVQQAVGHVLRQHALDVGTVDGWKTQCNSTVMGCELEEHEVSH